MKKYISVLVVAFFLSIVGGVLTPASAATNDWQGPFTVPENFGVILAIDNEFNIYCTQFYTYNGVNLKYPDNATMYLAKIDYVRNRICFVAAGGKVYSLDLSNAQFTKYPGIAPNNLVGVVSDSAGIPYVLHYSGYIYYLNGGSWSTLSLPGGTTAVDMVMDKSDSIWIIGNKKIDYYTAVTNVQCYKDGVWVAYGKDLNHNLGRYAEIYIYNDKPYVIHRGWFDTLRVFNGTDWVDTSVQSYMLKFLPNKNKQEFLIECRDDSSTNYSIKVIDYRLDGSIRNVSHLISPGPYFGLSYKVGMSIVHTKGGIYYISTPISAVIVSVQAFNDTNYIRNSMLSTSGGIVQDASGTVLDEARQAKNEARTANTKLDTIQTTVTNIQNSIGADTTPPVVKIRTVSGAVATSGGSIQAVLDVSDNLSSTFTYSLDGSLYNPLPVNKVISLPVSSPGPNVISVWVKDQAGNVGTASISIRKL
ncbi:MAG: hypothetical protein VR68_03895 [Peptococcaceae bacterium BRH_c4a]|nr:MAG: hypothetical protein VR68_03895 [Peptococcaceae bacterium BRH_c4a]